MERISIFYKEKLNSTKIWEAFQPKKGKNQTFWEHENSFSV